METTRRYLAGSRIGILPMNQTSSVSKPAPVLSDTEFDGIEGEQAKNQKSLFELLDESVVDQKNRMFDAIEEAWNSWAGAVENPGLRAADGRNSGHDRCCGATQETERRAGTEVRRTMLKTWQDSK